MEIVEPGMKHLRLVLILSFNLALINFGQSQSSNDLDGKRMATVKGVRPYMTSKVLFGDVTQLKAGQQIQIIGFESNKVKVVLNGVQGFIHQEFFDASDISIAKQLGAEQAKKTEEQVEKTSLLAKRRIDSLTRLHSDSIFFLVKAIKSNVTNQLFDSPNGKQILNIEPEETILVRGFTNYSFLKVLHLNSQRVGYVYWFSLDLPANLKDSINHTLERIREAEDRANEKALAESLKKRKLELTKRFGAVNAQKILDRKIWIGMTSEMARIVLGEPERNNRTVTATTIKEQWVYPNREYYYFTNGILTAWQD